MFRSSTLLLFRNSSTLLLALKSNNNNNNNNNTTTKVLSPSEEAMKATRGVIEERDSMIEDFSKARDESLRQQGAKVNSVKDIEFDEKTEETTGMKTSPNNNLPFRIKVTKPSKPNMDEPCRVEVKAGQKFVDAVSEHLNLKEEAEKRRDEFYERHAQRLSDRKLRKKNLKKQMQDQVAGTFSSSSCCPTTSAAFSQTRVNLQLSSSTTNNNNNNKSIPKAPPLPGMMNLRAPPLPQQQQQQQRQSGIGGVSDDEICFHLRAGIEKSPSVQKDLTSLQLSLTEGMMNAIAHRHENSLKLFIQRFPARFSFDPATNKVELIGVQKNSNNQQQPNTTPKPLTPSELKKQQLQRERGLPGPNNAENRGGDAQNQQQHSSMPPPPSLNSVKFAAPSLPNLRGSAGGVEPGATGGTVPMMNASGTPMSQQQQHLMETAFMTKSWKSPAQIVEELMEYIPTYWIPTRHVHNQLPFEIKELYQQKMRLNHFLKKFNFYFDAKITPRGAEIKVRDDCKHPKKGAADERYGTHLRQMEQKKEMEAQAMKSNQQQRIRASLNKKPRYVEVDPHSLAGQLKQLCSNQFQTIRDFQNSLPGTVTSHPEYDAGAGVLPTLEKHPFIFQVANDSVRLRQTGVAPNSLDSKGKTPDDSPLPHIFAKIMRCLPAESYDDTAVEVSAILAKLSSEEREEVKKASRSLPRFLRLHGAAMEISRDNSTVRRWEEPSNNNNSAGGTMNQAEKDEIDALNNNEEVDDPNEPEVISDGGLALPKPGKDMAEASNVQWALKELYSSLPLSTCVVLDDAISMLPSQMRDAAATCENLVGEMERYPDYFQVWRSPDDGKTLIVQRTMVGTPADITDDDVFEHASTLIPQGGIDSEKLLRRMSPKMQRYLFRHGLKTTLKKKPDDFLVVGDKILYIVERE